MSDVGKRFLSVAMAALLGEFLHATDNPVLDWSAMMMSAIRADNSGPTLSTRNLAILNVATFDAVNSITRLHQPYRFQLDGASDTSVEAAVIAAGREITLALYPSFNGRCEELYQSQLALLPATAATTSGLALGSEVALRVLALRAADGSSTDVPYIPSSLPGQWQRTPAFFRPPLTPHWRFVNTFCIPDLTPFLPQPPPALESAEYARAFEEVKRLGEKNSPWRTPEQSLIAVFWSDFSYTAMPPGHWHEIAADICRKYNISIVDSARLFALLGLAQADVAILCWEAKFRWNLWRPVTAIRRADEDANPLTEGDPAWDHYLNSPPFPSYTSGHSTFSQSSGQILKHFFGTDELSFTALSDSLPGIARDFQSIQACVNEVGMSRIYGGIHFQFDNAEGKRTGGMIGDFVSANYLLPNDALPLVRLETLANDAPVLRVHGRIGGICILECSGDLKTWQRISTNVAVAGGIVFHDAAAKDQPMRFYRVRH